MGAPLLTETENHDACRILQRGLHNFNKLKENQYLLQNHNTIPEYCFYLRSLAEICEGMRLWFCSLENLKIFSQNCHLDFADILGKAAKNVKIENGTRLTDKKYSDFIDQIEKIYSKSQRISYKKNGGFFSINSYRMVDPRFSDTFKLTSKIIHQDEFSIGSIYIYTLENWENKFPFDVCYRLQALSKFWRDDFKKNLESIGQQYDWLIAFYNQQYPDMPLPVD